jgi:hypothetical protein
VGAAGAAVIVVRPPPDDDRGRTLVEAHASVHRRVPVVVQPARSPSPSEHADADLVTEIAGILDRGEQLRP